MQALSTTPRRASPRSANLPSSTLAIVGAKLDCGFNYNAAAAVMADTKATGPGDTNRQAPVSPPSPRRSLTPRAHHPSPPPTRPSTPSNDDEQPKKPLPGDLKPSFFTRVTNLFFNNKTSVVGTGAIIVGVLALFGVYTIPFVGQTALLVTIGVGGFFLIGRFVKWIASLFRKSQDEVAYEPVAGQEEGAQSPAAYGPEVREPLAQMKDFTSKLQDAVTIAVNYSKNAETKCTQSEQFQKDFIRTPDKRKLRKGGDCWELNKVVNKDREITDEHTLSLKEGIEKEISLLLINQNYSNLICDDLISIITEQYGPMRTESRSITFDISDVEKNIIYLAIELKNTAFRPDNISLKCNVEAEIIFQKDFLSKENLPCGGRRR